MVDKTKSERLAAAGWRTGDAADFLELSAEETAFLELKLALADFLREIRLQHGWTQAQVARQLGSSQSRIAKMEAADASVSVDLLVKSLLTLGASRKEVGKVIGRGTLLTPDCPVGDVRLRFKPDITLEAHRQVRSCSTMRALASVHETGGSGSLSCACRRRSNSARWTSVTGTCSVEAAMLSQMSSTRRILSRMGMLS